MGIILPLNAGLRRGDAHTREWRESKNEETKEYRRLSPSLKLTMLLRHMRRNRRVLVGMVSRMSGPNLSKNGAYSTCVAEFIIEGKRAELERLDRIIGHLESALVLMGESEGNNNDGIG